MEKELIEWMLPAELVKHFDIDKIEEEVKQTVKTELVQGCLVIHLVEKNIIPTGYSEKEFESKGFTDPKRVADFPIRGRQVYLSLKCRRWRHKKDKSTVIQTDFSFIADGTRMTKELAAFLKDTSGDAGRNT